MAEFLRLPTRSTGLKFLLVVALAALMGIPMLFVYGVMKDRLSRSNDVLGEISASAGGSQNVLGPVLLVPYETKVQSTNSDNKTVVSVVRNEAVVFADTGLIEGALTGEERRRGIYKAPVYTADLRLAAHFDLAESAKALAALDPQATYDWKHARMVIGVSNTKGVLKNSALEFSGQTPRLLKPITTVTGGSDPQSNSFTLLAAPVDDLVAAGKPLDVRAALTISGAGELSLATFAKDTSAKVSGTWPSPSFVGGFPPTTRKTSGDAFSAEWNAPLARRGIAEVGADPGILGRAATQNFAIDLVAPTTVYTGVDRAMKYSMMFIGLVFVAYFMFEIVSGLRAHPAQYVMVGLAQAIFYLLLLAFAERIGFDLAFLIAAGATITLISLYVGVVFKQRRYTGAAFAVFVVVYALMYVLMQAEDYALLVGALASFGALAALMYLTRNVAWYGAGDEREGAAAGPP